MIIDISYTSTSRICNAVVVITLASSLLYGCSTVTSVNKGSDLVAAATSNASTCEPNQTITTLEINGEQKLKIVSSGPINLVLGNNEMAQPAKPETPELSAQKAQNSESSQSITFLSSTAKLTKENKQRIRDWVPQAHQARIIYVRGRTDASGNKIFNRRLAITRASNVKNELVSAGVDPKKIKIMYCTQCYLTSNDSEEGRSLNRRVDIQFDKE